jgi:hypothetical protein
LVLEILVTFVIENHRHGEVERAAGRRMGVVPR